MENLEEKKPVDSTKETTEVAVKDGSTSMNYMDATALNKIYKNAQVLASSELLPDTYKGKPQNLMIAMDIASRTNFGLMTVCQNLYIVKQKPCWSGQFCVSAIKGCGRYRDIEYVWFGEGDDYGCYLQAVDRETGKLVKGSAVTWRMVKSEGWLDKTGSKWKSMPEQMFKYRAASFFARTECPDVLMGLQTVEEVKDVNGYEEPKKSKTTITLDTDFVEVEK